MSLADILTPAENLGEIEKAYLEQLELVTQWGGMTTIKWLIDYFDLSSGKATALAFSTVVKAEVKLFNESLIALKARCQKPVSLDGKDYIVPIEYRR